MNAIDKLTIIKNWCDYQDVNFIYKIKSIVDLEKLCDYASKNEIDYLDWEGIYNHADTPEECTEIADKVEKLLGYKVY